VTERESERERGGEGREGGRDREREIPAVRYDAATDGYCFGRGPVFFLMRVR